MVAGVVQEDFFAQARAVDVEVDFGGGNVFVPQHLLDCTQIGTAFEQVGRLLADVPAWLVDPAAIVLTAVFSADVVRSVQDALDLKEILTRVTEENEDLRRLAKRAEVAAAFAEDDLRKFRERTEVEKLLLQKRIEEELEEQRQARQDRKIRRREVADNALRRRTAAKLEALRNIAEVLEDARDHLEDARDQSKDLSSNRRPRR